MNTWGNRLKFALAGEVLEAVNPLLPGKPHRELIRHVAQYGGSRVLELCAGTGYASRLLIAERPNTQVVGVDLSPEMIAVGRRKLNSSGTVGVTLVVGDIAELPYPDDSFDVVMTVFGLHEVPTTVRESAVAESARVLVPGGRIVIVDLDRPRLTGLLMGAYLLLMEPSHAREIMGSGLVDLLVEYGFTIDHHRQAGGVRLTQTIVATAGRDRGVITSRAPGSAL